MIQMAFNKMKLKHITKKIHVNSSQEKQKEDSDEMNTNEKHVSLNLYIEKNKPDPATTISDEYTSKGIKYTYSNYHHFIILSLVTIKSIKKFHAFYLSQYHNKN